MTHAPSHFADFVKATPAKAGLPDAKNVAVRIKLLPAGTFKARDGRGPFMTGDRATMEAIVAATKAYHGDTDMMVDYDHQTVFGSTEGVGGRAVAAGWIDGLEVADDGIYATVKWTDAAFAALSASEYRYISPYFTADDKTGDVQMIINAALTNMPALDMAAIAASSQKSNDQLEGLTMDKIIAALGLSAGSKEDAVLASIAELKTGVAALATITAKAKEQKIGEDAKSICVALSSKASGDEPDPAKFVPMAMYSELSAKVAKIETDATEAKAEEAVALATRQGRVTPAQKDWALKYAKSDLAGFTAFAASAPVLVKPQSVNRQTLDPASGLTGTAMSVEDVTAKATKYQKEQKDKGIDVGWGDACVAVTK